MSIFDNPDQLRLLQNLLNPTERRDFDESDDDDDGSLVRNNITPGSIGLPGRLPAGGTKTSAKAKTKKTNPLATPLQEPPGAQPKTVEEWQEQQLKMDEELLDTRKRPEYSCYYRQAVGTEDVFLQMGNRSAATASCEDLVLEIKLPEESVPAEKMNLSIKEREIDLSTPVYHLKLPLVQPVNVDRCRAQYDADVRKMTLTLRLNRELDFINF